MEGLLGVLGRVCDLLFPEFAGLEPDDQEPEFREEEEDLLDWVELEAVREVAPAAGKVAGTGRLSSHASSIVSAALETVRQKTLGWATAG